MLRTMMNSTDGIIRRRCRSKNGEIHECNTRDFPRTHEHHSIKTKLHGAQSTAFIYWSQLGGPVVLAFTVLVMFVVIELAQVNIMLISLGGNVNNNDIANKKSMVPVRRRHPRIIFLSSLDCQQTSCTNLTHHHTEFKYTAGELNPHPSDQMMQSIEKSPPSCVQKEPWHSLSFVNCNSFHEIDTFGSILGHGRNITSNLQYLDLGSRRDAWLLDRNWTDHQQQTERVALKTLRLDHNYTEFWFDGQRLDALVSERLTGSPHIIDTYGFCGMSTMNEFAQYGKPTVSKLKNLTSGELLSYARDVALGLADIHEIDYRQGSKGTPSLVHGDFIHKNLLLTAGHRIKISDFNRAQLMRWDFGKNESCFGFSWPKICGNKVRGNQVKRTHNRSPEECMGVANTSERTEVHHLGSVLHFLLTKTNFPYIVKKKGPDGKTHAEPEEIEKVKSWILGGKQPPLPPEIEESSDPAIQAIVRARREAYTFDMNKRPRARDIANILNETYHVISQQIDIG